MKKEDYQLYLKAYAIAVLAVSTEAHDKIIRDCLCLTDILTVALACRDSAEWEPRTLKTFAEYKTAMEAMQR